MGAPSYDGQSAAASVIISPTTRARPVVFVEGVCEVRLISHHYPGHETQIVPCCGHAGVKEAIAVIEAWEESNNTKLSVLGFIDRDYGSRSSYRRITVTNNRDIEIDMYMTAAGERLLREKASSSKCSDPRTTISNAMEELRIVGLIRKYNSDNACSWGINTINLERCINPDGSLNIDKLVSAVRQKNSLDDKESIELNGYLKSNASIRTESILRGHDVSTLLGKWLRKKIGNRKKIETSWKAIEEDLRLATNLAELLRYNWARRLRTHLTRA